MAHIKTYDDGTIALVDIWTLEDIQQCAEYYDIVLCTQYAIETLELLCKSFDSEIGINWDSIYSAICTVLNNHKGE